ncbi:hypothetical protein HQO24_10595 [Rhodococcus fascians]|nr:hypothetical protein [Rhodococcus fascians]MBY4396871.1 hypothetical protein [Rhodococcus fascians]MBY4407350.1 hypothetical protein [Rhodococcus fascians]MBY4421521.1 hypothetical protein [Rhodococcus fascians]MBY4460726.1 hypothetical protein [Rhodococcus fascians]
MQESSVESPPVADTGDGDVCPDCGHNDRFIEPRNPWGDWMSRTFRTALGMKPKAATCKEDSDDAGMWGSDPCGCRNPAHGS